MIKIRNINTNVIKELKSEVEASMYLTTGEWKIERINKIDSSKEEKNSEK